MTDKAPTTDEQKEAFVDDLTALMEKHNVVSHMVAVRLNDDLLVETAISMREAQLTLPVLVRAVLE